MTHGAAAGHVKLAAKLVQLPDVADAFAQGELSRQHAYAIADAYTVERADALDGIAPALVAAAKDVNPSDLRSLVKHATDAIDGVVGAAKHERPQLYTANTLDGMIDSCRPVRVHHDKPWSHGGSTNLDNLKAKCAAHHWRKHHCPP